MLASIAGDIRQWAEKYIGTIQSAEKLKGGISTSIFGLKAEKGDYVLRVVDNDEWLAEEPDLAEHEAAALQLVAPLPVPTPQLIAYDNAVTCTKPVVLSTWMPGKVDIAPQNLEVWLQELATTLAKIHQLPAPEMKWRYGLWFSPQEFAPPAATKYPDLWQKAKSLLHLPPPETKICLIHRDYHPANVLFQNGKISAVIDWINACIGDVGVDVASCKSDIVCLQGMTAANQFQQYYEAATGIKHHPLCDVYAILDFYDSKENVESVLQSWHDLGRTDLTEALIYQRADEYLLDIMRHIQ